MQLGISNVCVCHSYFQLSWHEYMTGWPPLLWLNNLPPTLIKRRRRNKCHFIGKFNRRGIWTIAPATMFAVASESSEQKARWCVGSWGIVAGANETMQRRLPAIFPARCQASAWNADAVLITLM